MENQGGNSTGPAAKSSTTTTTAATGKAATTSRPKPILVRANSASNSTVSLVSYSTSPTSQLATRKPARGLKTVDFLVKQSESEPAFPCKSDSLPFINDPSPSANVARATIPTSPSDSSQVKDHCEKESGVPRFKKKGEQRIMRSKSFHQPNSHSHNPRPENQRGTRPMTQTIADLLTCPICLEQLQRPTMLPCQHTFCLVCLQNCVKGNVFRITCPTCREVAPVPGQGVAGFPRNLSILSFIELLKQQPIKDLSAPGSASQERSGNGGASLTGPDSSAKPKSLCQRCKEVELFDDTVCLHCHQGFCAGCRLIHEKDCRDDYHNTLENLLHQSDSLELLDEELKVRCDKVQEHIDIAAQVRIQKVLEAQSALKEKVEAIAAQEAGKLAQFRAELEIVLPAILEPSRLATSVPKAQELLQKLRHYGQSRLTFNEESFDVQFESGEGDVLAPDSLGRSGAPLSTAGTAELSATEIPSPNSDNANGLREIKKSDLLVSADDKSLMYRSKSGQPKSRFTGTSLHRPAGVAVSPWTGEIYVAGTDSHKVVVFDKQGKVIRYVGQPFRRSSAGSNTGNGFTVGAGHFLCPFGIAFSTLAEEIYVTDKWLNCIQVFDKDGHHKRKLGMKGTSPGQFRSPEGIAVDANGFIYVCDTCNDRVQVLDRDGVFIRELGIISQISLPKGERYQRSEFNEPTGIAVTRDGSRIAVCDYGNCRVKTYASNGDKIGDFGFKGSQKGQFMFPECLAMDEQGFIIVADNGNGRVQIFRPNGNFVRLFGSQGPSAGQFNWIAGLALSPDNEIIVSDFKNHCIQVY